MRNFALAASLFLGLSAASSGAQPPEAPPSQWPGTGRLAIRDVPATQREPLHYDVVNGFIMFKATIGGIPVMVLLDNGADRTLVDSALVDISPTAKPDGTVQTPTGTLPFHLVSAASIILPGQVEIRSAYRAIDLAPISRNIGRQIDVIFGADMLAQMGLVVNARSQTLQFMPSGSVMGPEGLAHIPLNNDMGQMDMLIGDKPVRVTLDLGSNSALSLTPEAWTRVGPKGQQLKSSTTTHAEGQTFKVDVGQVPSATLGTLNRQDVVVSVRQWPIAKADGIVGLGFLADTDFTLDLRAGKLWLMPPKPALM